MRIVSQRFTWRLLVACPECKADLEVEADDLCYGDFGGAYADEHEWLPYVLCPACKSQVALRQGVPQGLVKELSSQRASKESL